MIESLEIHNYRSCVDTSIALQRDLSVLIGPNGSGKTNVLNAFLLLRRLAEQDRERHYFRHTADDEGLDESRLKATFLIDGRRAVLTALVKLYQDESNADVIVHSNQEWYAPEILDTRKRFALPLSLATHLDLVMEHRGRQLFFNPFTGQPLDVPPALASYVTSVAKYLAEIRYYSASQFTNPSQCPVSVEVEKEGRPVRGRRIGLHSKFLSDLHAEYKTREKSNYDRFFDVIGPAGVGLVDNITFQEIPTSSVEYTVRSGGRYRPHKREKILLIPQFIIGANKLSPSQLSEGTFKTITLLFYLITQRSSSLFVEEPEVCVHHGLLLSIVDLIKSYSSTKQILVSTHSDLVLDRLEPRHVYKVSRDKGSGTSIQHIESALSSREVSALKTYLETEGNLGEYWKHGGLD